MRSWGDADMDWWMGGAAGGVARFVFPAPGRELGDEGANGGNGMETGHSICASNCARGEARCPEFFGPFGPLGLGGCWYRGQGRDGLLRGVR